MKSRLALARCLPYQVQLDLRHRPGSLDILERDISEVGFLAGGGAEPRTFDLFELFPDGYVLWRGTIRGLRKARVELQELAAHTKHEVQLMYAPNNAVIAKRNVPEDGTAFPVDTAPRIGGENTPTPTVFGKAA